MSSDDAPPKGRYFWERAAEQSDGTDHKPSGADLAALRRGVGTEPGAAPEMWVYYTHLAADGSVSRMLRAEHTALCLFGLHQQSESQPMHRPGVTVGHALRALRASDRYSPQAVDARVQRAATATDLTEMTHHLRGLVQMLKTLRPPQGLDYTQLFWDLVDWQRPERIGRVRRRWGADYLSDPAPKTPTSTDSLTRKDQP